MSRALVKFGDLSAVPAGTKIDSAQLRLYYDQLHTTNDNAHLIEAHRATSAWNETSATWDNANTKLGELSGTTTVVDDGDPGTAQTGTWTRTQTSDGSAVGNDFLESKNASTADSNTWTPKVIDPGQYFVDVHYRQHADGATAAPYTVNYSGGSQTVTVDQSAGAAGSGVWQQIALQTFAAGTAGNVKLGDITSATQRLIADAIRLRRPGTSFIGAGDEGSKWSTFSVKDTVQDWVNNPSSNFGFMIKDRDEDPADPAKRGGPRYEGSLFFYQGETATYPQLVITYGRPSVEIDPITTIRSTGADLSWPAYNDPSPSADDDAVEYQLHRSVWQSFTPSQATLVAPLPSTARSYSDTSAPPTPASDPDPFGNSFYYMLAVKTRDGEVIPGPTQLVRLPKAGRVTKIYQAAAGDSSVADTTLTEKLPDTNQDVLAGQPWLSAGNNSATFGRARTLLKFPALSAIPSTATVADAQVKMWTAGVDPGGLASYELRALTRDFDEKTATWNKANSTTAWTTPGG
ncbi:MAG: DNRLRE domain-containing protein, partial [Stackebrandtia sp.]